MPYQQGTYRISSSTTITDAVSKVVLCKSLLLAGICLQVDDFLALPALSSLPSESIYAGLKLRELPALKNALDWASREPDNRLLAGKAAAIMGAGGGMGTSRAQYHLRQVGVFLDLHFVNKPEVFVNAFSGVFAADGALQDEKIRANIQAQLVALQTLVLRCKK